MKWSAPKCLLVKLSAAGKLPKQPDRVRQIVAPIVCTSKAEQRDFYRRFDDQVTNVLEPDSPDTGELIAQEVHAERRRFTLIRVAAVLVALLVLAISIPSAFDTEEEPIRPDPKVVSPSPRDDGGPDERVTLSGSDTAAFPAKQSADLTIVATQVPGSPTVEFLSEWRAPIIVATGLVLLLLTLRWWRQKQASIFLERRQLADPPEILATAGRTSTVTHLFRTAGVSNAARRLRKRVIVPSNRLNIAATLRKTIQNGGQFQPELGTRQVSPDYLVLIEQTCEQDHVAQVAHVFVDRLIDEQIGVDCYYFDYAPTVCRRRNRHETVSLEELVARNPDLRLIVCARAACFFSSFTGRPEEWISLLEDLPARILLSTDPVTEWGYHEWHLTQQGMVVLPLSPDGVAEIAEGVDETVVGSNFPAQRDPRLPQMLREDVDEWLSRRAPDDDRCVELIEGVRAYLGKQGLLWFSACAVYPEINWDLTLCIGQTIAPELCSESRILSMSRLPWMRAAWTPDWLRELLIAQLSPEEADRVRFAINTMLLGAVQDPNEQHGPLKIAWEDRRWLATVGDRLFRRVRAKSPDDPVAQDYVLARFVEVERVSNLLHRLPQPLGDFVRGRLPGQRKPRSVLMRLALWVFVLGVCGGIAVMMTALIRDDGTNIVLPRQDASEIAGYGSELAPAITAAIEDLEAGNTVTFVEKMFPPGELAYARGESDVDAIVQLMDSGPRSAARNPALSAPLRDRLLSDLKAIQQFLLDGGEPTYNQDRTTASFELVRVEATRDANLREENDEAQISPQRVILVSYQAPKTPAGDEKANPQNSNEKESKFQGIEKKAISALDVKSVRQYKVTCRFQLINGSWRFFDAADQLRRVQMEIVR